MIGILELWKLFLSWLLVIEIKAHKLWSEKVLGLNSRPICIMGINSNYLSGKDSPASYLRPCVSKFSPLSTVPTGLTSSQALFCLCHKWAIGVLQVTIANTMQKR